MAERTLHYLFLAPVRREVLVLGKFLAGALTTVVVFLLWEGVNGVLPL